jgi:hypothetical protein
MSHLGVGPNTSLVPAQSPSVWHDRLHTGIAPASFVLQALHVRLEPQDPAVEQLSPA